MPLLYNWSHYLTVFRCLLEKIERAGLFYYFSIFFFDEKINTRFGRKLTAVNYVDQIWGINFWCNLITHLAYKILFCASFTTSAGDPTTSMNCFYKVLLLLSFCSLHRASLPMLLVSTGQIWMKLSSLQTKV